MYTSRAALSVKGVDWYSMAQAWYDQCVQAGLPPSEPPAALRELWLQQILTQQAVNDVLLHAAMEGDADLLDRALAAGADMDAADRSGIGVLGHAARCGHAALCAHLIASGSKMHARNKDGWTPLHFAAAGGHADVCEELLRNGAEVDAIDRRGATSLMSVFPSLTGLASVHNPEHANRVASCLLRHGADPFRTRDDGAIGTCPLWLAAASGDTSLFMAMLKIARVSSKTSFRARHKMQALASMLCMAAKQGRVDVCEMLVDSGADVNFGEHAGGFPPLAQALEGSMARTGHPGRLPYEHLIRCLRTQKPDATCVRICAAMLCTRRVRTNSRMNALVLSRLEPSELRTHIGAMSWRRRAVPIMRRLALRLPVEPGASGCCCNTGTGSANEAAGDAKGQNDDAPASGTCTTGRTWGCSVWV